MPLRGGAIGPAVAVLPHGGKTTGRFADAQGLSARARSGAMRRSLAAAARHLAPIAALTVLVVTPVGGRAATATATQTLQADISPLGGLFSFPGTLTLTETGTTFGSYTGSLAIQYDARTSPGGSGGSITVKATADFLPSGGPSITSPPTSGDALRYTCSGATLGSGCSGTQTVSTTTSTNVLTIPVSECTGGGGSCSSTSPNTVSVNFTLTDDPRYSTGSYSATLTFTISAT